MSNLMLRFWWIHIFCTCSKLPNKMNTLKNNQRKQSSTDLASWFSHMLIMDPLHGFLFLKKIWNLNFKKLKTYSLLPRFTSGISYPSNWLPVSDRVEYYIANTVFKYWNGIIPGYIYIHEIFNPSLRRYRTRTQMALDIPLGKTNTGQKSLSFSEPKIWSKIGLASKMLERRLLL